MNLVYPSIEEIMPDMLLSKIPVHLAADIEERYRTLGDKYLTETRHEDGRFINACMYKSSVQDAIEEVIDAVFNVLVWVFKARTSTQEIPDSAYTCLVGLIEIYSLLATERQRDAVVS